MQWKMVCKFFYLNTVLFMLFLSVYFFFIVGIFYHEDKEEWCNLKADKLRHILTCQNWNCPTLFSRWDNGFLVCEILLMITTVTLTLREIIQLISRMLHYIYQPFRNPFLNSIYLNSNRICMADFMYIFN